MATNVSARVIDGNGDASGDPNGDLVDAGI
jgi:hypothetical protein